MKSIILSAAALLLSVVSFGQYSTPPDYFREIGVNVGVAPFTRPGLAKYVGDKNKLPYMVSGNFHYNFTEHIQIGLDLAMTRWEGSQEQQYYGTFGQPSQSRTTNYVYADRVWDLTARFNYLFPMYDHWHINRANFYIGAAAGAAFTVNDGRLGYNQYMQQAGEDNRYVSAYNYASGTGFVVGLQVGYSYYVGNHVGINIEVAPRYTHVYMQDARYNHANNDFDVWSYPVSAGVKFRF